MAVLVSVQWLQEQISSVNIRVLDGTLHSLMWKRDAEAEYLSGHIEGAVRFNLDEIADKSSPFPQTIPSPQEFGEQVGKLGISNSNHVVIYDNHPNLGMYSAARVWYMFRLFGHEKVSILEGGLPKWQAQGGKIVTGPQLDVKPVEFKVTYCAEMFRSFEQTLDAYKRKTAKILDVRSPGRFTGKQPEPHPEIPSGHIIGTKNLFWETFFTPDTKIFKTREEIEKVFSNAGVNFDQSYIASCGSGITACWITLAAFICGKNIPVFTGSWLEWVKRGPDDSKVLGVKGEDLK